MLKPSCLDDEVTQRGVNDHLCNISEISGFDCFSVMRHCISYEASMRAKQFCVLAVAECSVKIWSQ